MVQLVDGYYSSHRIPLTYRCVICKKAGTVLNPVDQRMFQSRPTEHNACRNAIGYTNADMGNAVTAGDMEGALHHYGRYLRAVAGNPDPDSWDMPTLKLRHA